MSSGPVTRAGLRPREGRAPRAAGRGGPARRRAAGAPRRDGAGGRARRRGRAPRRGPEGHRPRRSPRRDAGPPRHDHRPDGPGSRRPGRLRHLPPHRPLRDRREGRQPSPPGRARRGAARSRSSRARPCSCPPRARAPATSRWPGLMAEAKRLQARPGVLAVSLFPVQPWLDIPDTGFSVMAVADGPRRAAEIEPMIRQLAWQAWERRRGFAADLLTVDDAIRRALAAEGGPFILSESADSTGSGSPGDSAHVLERLLALDVRERCLVTVVDAPAVARAIAAGVGRGGDHHRGRHARPALQPAGPAHRAGPDPLRRPLHLVGQEVARRRVPDGARGRHRGRAHRHPGDRAARVHLRPRALPLRRPRAAGREDRGGEVAAPVPRRLRRLRPGVLGRRHARAQHGARRAARVASPLAPALPLRRRLRARDPRGRRRTRRDVVGDRRPGAPRPDLPLERRALGFRRRGPPVRPLRTAGGLDRAGRRPQPRRVRPHGPVPGRAVRPPLRDALRPSRGADPPGAPRRGHPSGPARSRCPPAIRGLRSTTGTMPCPGRCPRPTRRRADGAGMPRGAP